MNRSSVAKSDDGWFFGFTGSNLFNALDGYAPPTPARGRVPLPQLRETRSGCLDPRLPVLASFNQFFNCLLRLPTPAFARCRRIAGFSIQTAITFFFAPLDARGHLRQLRALHLPRLPEWPDGGVFSQSFLPTRCLGVRLPFGFIPKALPMYAR